MKKYIFIFLIIMILFISSCGKKQPNKDNNDNKNKEPVENIVVIKHIEDQIELIDAVKGDKIDFEFTDNSYVFNGWYDETFTNCLDGKILEDNIDIYAKVAKIGTEFKVKYRLDGGEFTKQTFYTYKVGTSTLIDIPVKEPYYNFLGWKLNGTFVTEIPSNQIGDIILDAIWEDTAEYYSLTYVKGDGDTQKPLKDHIRQGDKPYTLPKLVSNVEGKYFWGWYLEPTYETKVTEIDDTIGKDTTLYAYYGGKRAENVNISFLGDSISTFTNYIPGGFDCYYPQGNIKKVDDTWWYQLTQKLGFNLLMNDSYSGSKVNGGKMPTSSKERTTFLGSQEGNPDIVVIFMGTNDWASGQTKSQFKAGYKQMLDNIYEEFGNKLRIYVCLMPTNDYSEGYQTIRESFNDAIIELANDYKLSIIDFRTAITKDNLAQCTYSGVHPNAYGMTQMAECAYKVIYANEKGNYIE